MAVERLGPSPPPSVTPAMVGTPFQSRHRLVKTRQGPATLDRGLGAAQIDGSAPVLVGPSVPTISHAP
jgi:hypothetical protein